MIPAGLRASSPTRTASGRCASSTKTEVELAIREARAHNGPDPARLPDRPGRERLADGARGRRALPRRSRPGRGDAAMSTIGSTAARRRRARPHRRRHRRGQARRPHARLQPLSPPRIQHRSLTVGHSEDAGPRRMTLVVDGESAPVEQVEKQLYKLIDVVKVTRPLATRTSIARELALIKVRCQQRQPARAAGHRQRLSRRRRRHRHQLLTLQVVGDEDKIDGLIKMLRAVRHPRALPHRPHRHGARHEDDDRPRDRSRRRSRASTPARAAAWRASSCPFSSD